MANHKATLKSIRQTAKRTERNRAVRSRVKTLGKKARTAVNESGEQADKTLSQYLSSLDRAARKGLIHKNKAARLKSRLTKAHAKVTAQAS